jgi:hypothetical protein
MFLSMRVSCVVLAVIFAGPAAAQEARMATHLAAASQPPAGPKIFPFGVPTGLLKYCGADFVCYSGIPLRCAWNTRPYQDIARHQCFCVHDGCPQ